MRDGSTGYRPSQQRGCSRAPVTCAEYGSAMEIVTSRHPLAATTGGWASARLHDGRLVVVVPADATDDEVAAAQRAAVAAATD
jgi:hypothetical protein